MKINWKIGFAALMAVLAVVLLTCCGAPTLEIDYVRSSESISETTPAPTETNGEAESSQTENKQQTAPAETAHLLHLPKSYDLVVGDTFELFYKGILLCKDPYAYNIRVTCPIGKAWGRKFEVTPREAGTYTLAVEICDDGGRLIDKGSTTLTVKEKSGSPETLTNVLCIGDSLTEGGAWVGEFYRRLTATDAQTAFGDPAPIGDGRRQIAFVGSKTTANGAGYEGYGGWTLDTYLSTAASTSNYWVEVGAHTKTDNDQESIYRDASGTKWQLETVEDTRVRLKRYSGTGTLAASGTLTHVSGGLDVSDMVYTSATPEAKSPFVSDGAVDFSSYCDALGISTIHRCYILLGWNSVGSSESSYKAKVRELVDHLIAFNPDIRIALMGLQIPSLDGCANNYGATGVYADFRALQEWVFQLNRWYEELAVEKPDNVTFVNVAGQFDTENSMMTSRVAVHARSGETVTVQSNGLHPAKEGYYQIADAAYRHFNNH
ncbi:MAG: SGNH/GDSL hydrolase family protein [Clostridia bacterium]|nr:SGNH/GDSL hydrolase family protein [Clostridia bacterium]